MPNGISLKQIQALILCDFDPSRKPLFPLDFTLKHQCFGNEWMRHAL